MRDKTDPREGRLRRSTRPEYVALRQVLKEEMAKRGVGQRELAKRLNKDHTYIYRILSGARAVEWIELIDICRALGAEPETVFTTALRRCDA